MVTKFVVRGYGGQAKRVAGTDARILARVKGYRFVLVFAEGAPRFCDRDRRGATVVQPGEGGSWSGNRCVCNVWRAWSRQTRVCVTFGEREGTAPSGHDTARSPDLVPTHVWRPVRAKNAF